MAFRRPEVLRLSLLLVAPTAGSSARVGGAEDDAYPAIFDLLDGDPHR